MSYKTIGGLGALILAGLLGWFLLQDTPWPEPLKSWLNNSSSTADVSQNARANGGKVQADSGNRGQGGQQSQNQQQGRPQGRGGRRQRQTLVVISPVTIAISGDRLTSIGDGEAAASVTVLPRDAGLLTEVVVKSGDRVNLGDLLASLDSESEEIARDLAQRAAEDAAISQKRIARLVRSRAGSQADLDQANNTLARAQLTLRDAELKLSRRLITAPISGTVGIVGVTRGNRVNTATEIVTIDDRSRLLINFRVPERFANRIDVGQQVEATSFAVHGMQKGVVVGVGNRVDSNSRTLPVQAEIDNSADQLRTGMAFSVTLRFEGEKLPAVDPLAVQWNSKGSFVWKIEDQKAVRTAIQIVQRNTDSVLVRAELVAGDEIVTEGVMSLRDGATVKIAGGNSDKKQQRQPDKKPADAAANKPARSSGREQATPRRQSAKAEGDNT